LRILITGAGSVMGQSIYGALAQEAFDRPLEVAFANSDPLGAGQYFSDERLPIFDRPIFPLAADASYGKTLADYVQKNKIDFVFAGTQHELQKITEYGAVEGNTATLTPTLVDLCLDKAALADALQSRGVPVAVTWSASDFPSHGVEESIPYVVKPSFSSASRGIIYCANAQEVREALATATDLSQLVVQRALTGPEFTTGSYVDRFTGELTTITFKRTLSPDGASVFGEIVVDDQISRYMADIRDALVHVGFDYGHMNVQFMLTSEGPRLFEINGRLSSTEAPKAHFGFNSCAAYIHNKVLNEPYRGFTPVESGKFLRYYAEVYFDEGRSSTR